MVGLLHASMASTTATTTATMAAASTELPHYGRLYISAQPSDQVLADFKKREGAVVLDLRTMDELGNCSEPATTTRLGMRYQRVVFEKAQTIHPDVIAGIDRIVNASANKPVLVFCKTGNRASAWLAIHLVQQEQMPLENALALARGMGLKPAMEKSVRAYLAP